MKAKINFIIWINISFQNKILRNMVRQLFSQSLGVFAVLDVHYLFRSPNSASYTQWFYPLLYFSLPVCYPYPRLVWSFVFILSFCVPSFLKMYTSLYKFHLHFFYRFPYFIQYTVIEIPSKTNRDFIY